MALWLGGGDTASLLSHPTPAWASASPTTFVQGLPSSHSSANPQPGGHGEMTTTSSAFAVRRLHLDWPCHLWREGGGRSRWAVGVAWVGASPELCWALLSTSPASASHQPLAATSTPVTPNDTWSHLQGSALAAWKTPTLPSKPSNNNPSSRKSSCLPKYDRLFAKMAQLLQSLYVM